MDVITATTHTITVTDPERDLLRCALLGLVDRLDREITAAELREARGINVHPFLAGFRSQADSVRRMLHSL